MPKRKANENEVLLVGIDLGTSRSSVSTSKGTRKWVESYVGWPKDFVARKLLGQRVLFGSVRRRLRTGCRYSYAGRLSMGLSKKEQKRMKNQ